MFSKGIFTIENILILNICDIFGYRMDIKFSNKINLTIVYMVYKRRTWRYAIVWPQNDVKWNLFFFITRITIRKYPKKKKKKNNPTLYKSNNNISWQKRRWGGVCEKRVCEYGWQAIKNNNDWEKQTSSEWKVKCQS